MTNRQFTDPAAFLTARGYQVQTLAPAPAGPLAQLGRWIAANPSKVWPAVASAGVFALARWFHADGGTDPLNIALLAGLAIASGAAGCVSAARQHGDSVLTASAFASAAGLAVFDIAAATPHLPLALILVIGPMLLTYVLGALSWRDDRRSREQRQHERDLAELGVHRDITLAQLQLQERRESGMYAVALAEALQHRAGLTADTAPSPTASLGAPTARALPMAPAADQYAELLHSSLLQPTAEQLAAWSTARRNG